MIALLEYILMVWGILFLSLLFADPCVEIMAYHAQERLQTATRDADVVIKHAADAFVADICVDDLRVAVWALEKRKHRRHR